MENDNFTNIFIRYFYNIAIFVIIAYFLKPYSFGLLVITFAIIAPLQILSNLNASKFINYFQPAVLDSNSEEQDKYNLAFSALFLSLFFSIIFTILIFIFGKDIAKFFNIPQLEILLKIAVFVIIFENTWQILDSLPLNHSNILSEAVIRLISFLIFGFILALGGKEKSVILIYIISYLIFSIYSFSKIKNKTEFIDSKKISYYSRHLIHNFFNSLLPILIYLVEKRTILLILALFVSVDRIGAFQLHFYFYMIFTFFFKIYFNKLHYQLQPLWFTGNYIKIVKRFKKTLIRGVPIVLVMSIFFYFIVYLLVFKIFDGYFVNQLFILLFSLLLPVSFIYLLEFEVLLSFIALRNLHLKLHLFNAFLNIISYLILISRFKEIGAIIALLFTNLISSLVCYFIIKKRLGFSLISIKPFKEKIPIEDTTNNFEDKK